MFKPHPGRPHFWYRGIFTKNEPQCDLAGCHARPDDVVLTDSGHDSGFVTFQAGERLFCARADEPGIKARVQSMMKGES